MQMKSAIYVFYFLWLLTFTGFAQTIQPLKPLKENIDNSNKTSVSKYLSQKKWNELFPRRYGIGIRDSLNNNPDFYSFKTLILSATLFPSFLADGDDSTQK